MKPIHGAPKPVNVPVDMTDVPPVPVPFKPGDIVEFTNDYGLKGLTVVRGFSPTITSWGGFVYLDQTCWWLPSSPDRLLPLDDVPPHSETIKYKWRVHLANGRTALIDPKARTVTAQ